MRTDACNANYISFKLDRTLFGVGWTKFITSPLFITGIGY